MQWGYDDVYRDRGSICFMIACDACSAVMMGMIRHDKDRVPSGQTSHRFAILVTLVGMVSFSACSTVIYPIYQWT